MTKVYHAYIEDLGLVVSFKAGKLSEAWLIAVHWALEEGEERVSSVRRVRLFVGECCGLHDTSVEGIIRCLSSSPRRKEGYIYIYPPQSCPECRGNLRFDEIRGSSYIQMCVKCRKKFKFPLT